MKAIIEGTGFVLMEGPSRDRWPDFPLDFLLV